MKKLLKILFLVQFILISCNLKSEKKVNKETVIVEKSLEKEEPKTEPKIKTTKVREYAKAILKNEISPSDNDETFECLKQIYTKDTNDLEFYFKVFRIIVDKSDGALSEVLGIEIMKFIKYNPDFFIEQYSDFKTEEKQKFIRLMAYEFYFSEPKHNEEIERYFNEVNLKIKPSTKQKILNSIKELTKIATEEILNQ